MRQKPRIVFKDLSVAGAKFHYEQIGRGRPVLLLHGFTLDHRSIKTWAEPVFRKSRSVYRRIYPDLPGMGRSRFLDGTPTADRLLEVLLGFIHHAIGPEPFLIVASSYGGYLARGILHRLGEQVEGMALLCPVVIADPSKRTLPGRVVLEPNEALSAKVSSQGDESERATFSYLVLQKPTIWKRCLSEIVPATRICDAQTIRSLERNYGFTFEDRLLDPCEKPVLVLTGRYDTVVGFKDGLKLLDLFPRATFAVLDRAGHNLPIEQPGIFEDLMRHWLMGCFR